MVRFLAPLLYHLYSHRAAHWSHPGGGQVGSPHAHLGLRGMRPAAAVAVHRRARPPHPCWLWRPATPSPGRSPPWPSCSTTASAGGSTRPRRRKSAAPIFCGGTPSLQSRRGGGPHPRGQSAAGSAGRCGHRPLRCSGGGTIPAGLQGRVLSPPQGWGRAATRAAPTFGGSGTIAEM